MSAAVVTYAADSLRLERAVSSSPARLCLIAAVLFLKIDAGRRINV